MYALNRQRIEMEKTSGYRKKCARKAQGLVYRGADRLTSLLRAAKKQTNTDSAAQGKNYIKKIQEEKK